MPSFASSPFMVIWAEVLAATFLPFNGLKAANPGRAQQPSLPGESSILAKYQKLWLPRAILTITAMRPRLLNATEPAATAAIRSAEAMFGRIHVQPASLK